MVAYSFQRRFCEQIVRGEKRQTIRADRKRHARPGEPIQLFFGMRTKHCRKLIDPDPVCTHVEPVSMRVPPCGLVRIGHPACPEWSEVEDLFARLDGFDDALDFTMFWRREHGLGLFEGVLIRWNAK